ncbi:hypothetical protein YPPY66_1610, partial [Yersinia pestis PY-66]
MVLLDLNYRCEPVVRYSLFLLGRNSNSNSNSNDFGSGACLNLS